jgi:threonyl-tRNA synthetase
VADRHNDYAKQVKSALTCVGLRPEADLRPESVGRKIRDGEVGKVPFMLVVGDREAEEGTVTVRTRGSKETQTLSLEQAATFLAEACSLPDSVCS